MCSLDSCVTRCGRPTIGLDDHADIWLGYGNGKFERWLRTVVDDNDFAIPRILVEGTAHGTLGRLLAIEDRDDNRNSRH